MSTQHFVHKIMEPGIPGDGFTAPEAAVVRADIDTAMADANAAALFAQIADNLYYNVMSPAKGPVAAGDGVTDDWAAIQHRLDNLPTAPNSARGGKVVLEPGHTYMISQTLTVSMPNTDMDGLVGGTVEGFGATTIKALPGFTGPLIKISIPSGSKGAWVRNMNLDANNVAGVTAGVEYSGGTISTADLDNISIYGGPTGGGPTNMVGILTGYNCQSIVMNRVIAMRGLKRGIEVGGWNRHIVARDCRFAGTEYGALIGMDTANPGDRVETMIFDACELYGFATAGVPLLVRNADTPSFRACYIEVSSSLTSVINAAIELGTATARPNEPSFISCRIGGNAKAQYAIDFVNVLRPYVGGGTSMGNFTTGGVKVTDTATLGIVEGIPVSTRTGLKSTPDILHSVAPAGVDVFTATVSGQSFPTVQIRNSSSGGGAIYLGAGGAAADVVMYRSSSNTASMAPGDSLRTDGSWNGGKFVMGSHHLWVDATGKLRIKSGAPTSDTDGTVVGSQT